MRRCKQLLWVALWCPLACHYPDSALPASTQLERDGSTLPPDQSTQGAGSDAASSTPGATTLDPLVQHFKARPKHAAASVTSALSDAQSGSLELHFLDVGQGDSTLVHCPDGSRILVDGGSGIRRSSQPTSAREHLLATLGRELHIDHVIVTHPDLDHYNALPFLLDGIEFERLTLVSTAGSYKGKAFNQWLSAIEASKVERIERAGRDPMGERPKAIECGTASVHRLAFGVEGTRKRWAANTSSMVLLISYGKFDAVLAGDATFETETDILENYPSWWLDSELLKIGHHGSNTTSSSRSWLEAVAPQAAIVSAALDNRHGHPRKSVIFDVAAHTEPARSHAMYWYIEAEQRAEESEFREAIWATGAAGHITVQSNGREFSVRRSR